MAASATTLFLVRHATHDRVDQVLCGRMPGVSLGAAGLDQAARLAWRFAGDDVAAVLSSPRERARETAQPIAQVLGLAAQVSPDLDEIDFGDWTGRSFTELAEDADWRGWNERRETGRPPGGESMREAQARVAQVLRTIPEAHPGGRVVAVGHCDVLKAAICGLLGLSLDRLQAFDLIPASVSAVALWPGGGKVLFLNDMSASVPATHPEDGPIPSRPEARR